MHNVHKICVTIYCKRGKIRWAKNFRVFRIFQERSESLPVYIIQASYNDGV